MARVSVLAAGIVVDFMERGSLNRVVSRARCGEGVGAGDGECFKFRGKGVNAEGGFEREVRRECR